MTSNPNPRVILLDIEGTTTPIDFVYQVLFPFARTHARAFLDQHIDSPEVSAAVGSLADENSSDLVQGLNPPRISNPPLSVGEVVDYFHWLMDLDRKSTPLKTLQGMIWEAGYQAGQLHGQVFADVPPALERWQRQDRKTCIYSSGSVLAQKLLFSRTEAGDLTRFIGEYFDTAVGAKRDEASYTRIADALNQAPSQILFVSDVVAELDAAATAGFGTLLSVREGNPPQPASKHTIIETFDLVVP